MLDDFVLVQPEVIKDFKIEHGVRHTLIDLAAGSLGNLMKILNFIVC